MRRFVLNFGLATVVALGAMALAAPTPASASMSCEGGWELKCSGNVCCTVCQADGKIGDCEAVQAN